MQQVKRSRYLFFSIDDSPFLDLAAFLRGSVETATVRRILALSLLTADRYVVTEPELLLVARLPADTWTPVEQAVLETPLDVASVEKLARKGLLVSDSEIEPLRGLRRREERLEAREWHPYAAFYHFMTRWQESETEAGRSDFALLADAAFENASRFIARHGPPPVAFHRTGTDGRQCIALPFEESQGALYDVLRQRKTVRSFQQDRTMRLRDLATLLRYVFGCHGTCSLTPETTLLHKTSPSGGSLHPIEAYPLVLRVDGLDSGLYHYDGEHHTLEPMARLNLEEVQELAIETCRGQTYAGSAHALVILSARWFRNFWKYRYRSRTYGVVLMDAGHLSQTFYLVAAELGLGAFYTAAIDAPRIEERLGLEAVEESAIGVCGCGIPADDGSTLGLDFVRFEPRRDDPDA
jgi:putative peptide maturation dehydrogenase